MVNVMGDFTQNYLWQIRFELKPRFLCSLDKLFNLAFC